MKDVLEKSIETILRVACGMDSACFTADRLPYEESPPPQLCYKLGPERGGFLCSSRRTIGVAAEDVAALIQKTFRGHLEAVGTGSWSLVKQFLNLP
jgi:hypothetical protein